MIEVQGLRKTFRVPVRAPGLLAGLGALLHRKTREVHAVVDVSFRIEQGERVGFLGPNGAGKTTTMKMLSGLLHPSAGTISVLGHRPQDREVDFLRRITLVMGQKQQLLWDLPPTETFELNRAMFDLDRRAYRQTLDELVALLALEPLLDKPVRNLSLGERMKCELCAALLHRPQVLFLDEPTIGLDVEMQAQVRAFIAGVNQRFGATVLLTSHYMQDIAALTPRLLIIDEGRLRYDGDLARLSRRIAPERRIVIQGQHPTLLELGFRVEHGRTLADVPTAQANPTLAEVLRRLPEAELNVEEPPLDEVMARYFREGERPC